MRKVNLFACTESDHESLDSTLSDPLIARRTSPRLSTSMHAHSSGYGETEVTHDGLAVGSSERAGDLLLQNLASIEIDEVAHLAGKFSCTGTERNEVRGGGMERDSKGKGVEPVRNMETRGEEGKQEAGREAGKEEMERSRGAKGRGED